MNMEYIAIDTYIRHKVSLHLYVFLFNIDLSFNWAFFCSKIHHGFSYITLMKYSDQPTYDLPYIWNNFKEIHTRRRCAFTTILEI